MRFETVRNYTEEDVRSAILASISPEENASIIEHIGLFPWKDGENVAIIKFINTPKFLQSLLDSPTGVYTHRLKGVGIAYFDRAFNGFTPVNSPKHTQDIQADIIAISGIGGHAYGSWSNSESGSLFMWLQDALPNQFPTCRIMLYGYDSKLDSQNSNRLSDYCAELKALLRQVRKTPEENHRPIIFITHSFGGIIAANTLVEAQVNERSLYNAIEAFFFFGTPHRGLDVVDEIRAMLVDPSHPRLDLIGQLDSTNEFLRDELHRFKDVLKERKVVTFYERKPMRQLVKESRPWATLFSHKSNVQQWSRSGPYRDPLSKENSLLGLVDEQEKKIPINEDHSRMVKFRNRYESAYESVVEQLDKIIPGAQERVLHRHGMYTE